MNRPDQYQAWLESQEISEAEFMEIQIEQFEAEEEGRRIEDQEILEQLEIANILDTEREVQEQLEALVEQHELECESRQAELEESDFCPCCNRPF